MKEEKIWKFGNTPHTTQGNDNAVIDTNKLQKSCEERIETAESRDRAIV